MGFTNGSDCLLRLRGELCFHGYHQYHILYPPTALFRQLSTNFLGDMSTLEWAELLQTLPQLTYMYVTVWRVYACGC